MQSDSRMLYSSFFLLLFTYNHVLCEKDGDCPTWMYLNGSSQCVCGVDLNRAVICNPSVQQIQVRTCYMITYHPVHDETIAGHSFYACIRYQDVPQIYSSVSSNASRINHEICHQFNRRGLFCGSCEEGYSPLVYTYKLNCKTCTETDSLKNWFTFAAIAFVPVTVFYIFVLLFQFNVNSPSLHGYVLLAQLLTQTFSTKTLLAQLNTSNQLVTAPLITLQTLYSIWNLNFFRAVGPDICLRISTLNALSVEYVVAFYPMLLIIITYIVIELYSRGFRMILFVWRPFQLCSMYFRKEWNMKSSLVNVFATFLLLSYNRLLDISFSLLMFITAYNPRGKAVGRYLYYDSSKEFFGEEHCPFGILAILVLFFFNFVPFLLLLLYPMRWFQHYLNCFKLSSFALHIFVNSFTGCYKDGTEPGTRDCRYFAALFFLVRFANFLAISCTYDGYFFIVMLVIMVCFSTAFMSTRPYRSKFSHHNNTMTVFLMIGILLCSCSYGFTFTEISRPESSFSLLLFVFCFLTLPHIYIGFLVLKWVYVRVSWNRLHSKYAQSRERVSSSSSLSADFTVCSTYNSI